MEVKMHTVYLHKYRLEVKLRELQNARVLDDMVAEISIPSIHLCQHPD